MKFSDGRSHKNCIASSLTTVGPVWPWNEVLAVENKIHKNNLLHFLPRPCRKLQIVFLLVTFRIMSLGYKIGYLKWMYAVRWPNVDRILSSLAARPSRCPDRRAKGPSRPTWCRSAAVLTLLLPVCVMVIVRINITIPLKISHHGLMRNYTRRLI